MLRKAGADVLVDNRQVAVVGIFEVLRSAKAIYGAWKKIRSHMVETPPEVVVLIDFPDFNFIIGRLARKLGSRVIYYIAPQVWAWRSQRVRSIKRFVDKMAVILPFELAFYQNHKMDIHYVGHPLLDALSKSPSHEEAINRYHKAYKLLVGLLPGSRHSEIRALLSLLLETAAILKKHLPELSFILPVAPNLDRNMIAAETRSHSLPIEIVVDDTYGVIRACDLIITASGTVTLESAILGTPMIIIYKVSPLTYYVGRHLIKVKYAGLPNLIAGRLIVPELLQKKARADIIANEALSFLTNKARLDQQRKDLEEVRKTLGTPGVADRVARLILEDSPKRSQI